MSAFTLKLIAMLFMLLDHVHSYLNFGPNWVSLLSRFVAPLFVYFLVEGFYYTHNRKKYAARLYIAAVIMFIGNAIINYSFHNVNLFTGRFDFYSLIDGNNILLTLALFFSILTFIERSKQKEKRIVSIIGIVLFSFLSTMSEGGMYLLPILFIFYFLYGNKRKICIGVIITSLIFFLSVYAFYMGTDVTTSLFDVLCYNSEWMMGTVCIPILLYNGERGYTSKFSKWLFYIFYPVHLWIIYILMNMFFR